MPRVTRIVLSGSQTRMRVTSWQPREVAWSTAESAEEWSI